MNRPGFGAHLTASLAWPGLPDADDVARGVTDGSDPKVSLRIWLGHDFGAVFGRGAGRVVEAEAARADEEAAAVATQLMAQRQVMAGWILDGLARRSPLRQGIDHAAATDAVWALMDPAVSCRLTSDREWSPGRFRDWFADAILRLLLPDSRQQATAGEDIVAQLAIGRRRVLGRYRGLGRATPAPEGDRRRDQPHPARHRRPGRCLRPGGHRGHHPHRTAGQTSTAGGWPGSPTRSATTGKSAAP
jgi:hypothetical protein